MIPNIENYMIEAFLLLVLVLFAFIDIKKREFPSPLTSGVLFVVALTNIGNIQLGILAFILAIFLLEMETFSGMADVKMITAIGFVLPNVGYFMMFTIVLLVFSTVYQTLLVKVLKKKQGGDFAYVPVILLAYITLLAIQYL